MVTVLDKQVDCLAADVPAKKKSRPERPAKVRFKATQREWLWALGTLLSLSLIGLHFYPAYLLFLLILVNRFKNDRYDFIIGLTLLFGGYSLTGAASFPFKMADVALVLGLVAFLIIRKSPVAKIVGAILGTYFLALFAIAMTSDETMAVQFLRMRVYMTIVYCFVPLMVFSGQDFSMEKFLHKTVLYSLLLAAFYVIDDFILNGFVLIPYLGGVDVPKSLFWNLNIHPFDMSFPRKFANGLYLMTISAYALARYYKLSTWQWIMIGLCFVAARTMTFVSAFLVVYVVFQGQFLRMMRYLLLALVGITAIYFIDRATGGFMRVQSTVDQFISLENAADSEDFSEFGTGRMAQVIPKWELLAEMDREWLGFGFLHAEKSTNPKYELRNPYYVGGATVESAAVGAEITQIQTVFDVGFLGLLIQTVAYLAVYWAMRRAAHAKLYLCVLLAMSIVGIGGNFAGLCYAQGLIMIGLALGCILLGSRPQPAKSIVLPSPIR